MQMNKHGCVSIKLYLACAFEYLKVFAMVTLHERHILKKILKTKEVGNTENMIVDELICVLWR